MRPWLETVVIPADRSWLLFDRQLPDFPFNWHYHPEFELTLTLNSEGLRVVGDHSAAYGDGDLVLLGPNLPHAWQSRRPVTGSTHRALVCWFTEAWIGALLDVSPELMPLRRLLDPLHAEHDFLQSFPAWRFARTPAERVRWEAARDRHPPVIHPVIRTHPASGRRGLFVNEGFTSRIVELTKAESDALLALLRTHLAKPEFTVRWRWKRHDLAFWDNRLTQHYATADYLPHRRVMHRATILGDRPY